MSEQRTRRMLATAIMASGVVLLGIGVAPGMVSAHIPVITDHCGGLSVSLSTYHGDSTNNQVVVTIDGAAQTFTFGSDFERTFSWSSTVDHSWTVVIDANRNSGHPTEEDASFAGTKTACNPTTTTTTTTSSTTTTTTPESTTTTTTTTPGESSSTTTTTTATLPESTSTSMVGQLGPTSSVAASAGGSGGAGGGGAAAVAPVLPATGAGDGSISLTVVAVTLILIGAVMLRQATKPTR